MPKKYIIGLVVVLVLALAVWLVPLALAAGNGGTQPAAQTSPAPSQGSGTTHQCPAAGGSGSSGATSGTAYQTY